VITRAEYCVIAVAECFRGDGEILISPIGNLPAIGARLAKLTFEPDLLMTDGVACLLGKVLPIGGERGPDATVEGWIRELDPIRKRVSLSLRETATGNPWEGVEKKYAEGTVVTGTIEKLAPFGAFVVLEPGLTGLLPTSEMGLPRGANVGKAYSVGKQVTLQVAQVDVRRKRISLTLQGKTLEGSRSDYQNYVKKVRREGGMSALAAAFDRLKTEP